MYEYDERDAGMANEDEKQIEGKMQDYLWGPGVDSLNRLRKFFDMHIAGNLSDKEYWKGLSIAYTDSDNLCSARFILPLLFSDDRPSRDYLMNAEERVFLNSLNPDEDIKIYRGMTSKEYHSKKFGLSWTLEEKVAQFFCEKYGRNFDTKDETKIVHTLTIKKKDIIAYFNERKEHEIIYIPSN